MDSNKVNRDFLRKIFIIFLAVVGIITTIKLAIIYYDSNFNPYALPSFCSVNQFIDCDGVAHTTHSQFFGIPLAYWGMFMYFFVLFLLFVDTLKHIKFLSFLKVFKHPYAYISALGFISFFISMILAGVSLFEIKKICILCVFTYFLNLFIALFATKWYYKPGTKYGVINVILAIYKCFKVSANDFFHAIRVRKYFVTFAILLAIAASILTYTTTSYVFTPQVKYMNSINEFRKIKNNPYRPQGSVLGDKDAKIIVYTYTDYRCPICRTDNLILHRAAEELSGVQFVHKNFPLDIDCNYNLKTPFHDGSCMLAKYSIAAEDQDRLWDINSELFEKNPKNEEDVLKIAKELGFDTVRLKKDADSEKTDKVLQSQIKEAVEHGLIGTPALVINGKVYPGIKPYYELKDILIKAGAIERKKH